MDILYHKNLQENYKNLQPMQGIEKTEAIYHQSPLWIEMEKYGVEEWTEHNQTIVIPSLVGV